METFNLELPIDTDTLEQISTLLSSENACFFDIETTGLSPSISNVYLIGAAEITDGKAILTQWFADDYTSEQALLQAFSDYLSRFDTVIHYNGSTFDVPYLTKKYVYHRITDPFLKLESLDLYREVSSFCRKHKTEKGSQNVFGTENLKLTTVEKIVGFDRGQDFSGKECIDIYTTYMQEKFAHNEENMASLRSSLMSHNRDDLIGTILSSFMLTYTNYKPNSPILTLTDDTAILNDSLPNGLRYPVTITYDHVRMSGDEVTIRIPLFKGTLYHYYKDYKNYYYLPEEDEAIHKSVGGYVDKEHRVQATAETCYTKKAGTFMPVPFEYSDEIPFFHEKNAPKGACYIETYSASAVEMISFLL